MSSRVWNNFSYLHNLPERVATFKNWELTHLDPLKLAKEGLIYLQTKEAGCQCVYCLFVIKNLKSGEDVLKKHLLFNPMCRYVQQVSSKPVGYDVGGPFDLIVKTNTVSENGSFYPLQKLETEWGKAENEPIYPRFLKY